jgi:hemolysin activation/secretion protein
VIEGRYGAIDLRNRANLSDRVAHGVLSGLDSGDIVATGPLERRLLLLSDVPGVLVKSTLSPGSEVGTSDLAIDLEPGRRVTGSVEADNGGSRYTGPYRFGGTVNLNNPTGNGDQISLRALASNAGLLYGRASYQALVGVATLGVAYSHLEYELGREFESLDADGSADIASLYASYPLVRSRDANLYVLGGLDAKWFEDRVGAASTITRREAQVLTLGLSGDSRDRFGGGGWNVYSIGATLGDLDIKTPADLAIDRLTARSNGSYGKLNASFARLQNVAGPLSLYGAVRGQIASKNLDSSEKMELGGPYGVRAYPVGEAYGDEGYLATAEARLGLPSFDEVPGGVELIAFIDVGTVRYAEDPWFTGPNVAHRSGYGVGVNWAAPNDFIVKVSYARKLGDEEATSAPDRDGRFWFQVAKLF